MSRSRPLGPAHRGGMAIPFLGVHTIQGDAGRYYDPGLRVGLLGGGYATERASLNVELALDWSNRGEQPGVDVDATQFMGDLAFSPLFHAPLGAVELVVGPKLGAWYSYMHADLPILGATTTTAHGWTLGTNGGVLFPTSGSMAAGVLLSYQFRDPTEACTNSSSSQFKVCQGSGDAIHILGFNAALMF